ncbi:hypothetical protein GCM10012275_60830 [Longimycelium tulufanense]|uniref:Uncharacterized protein n=1 Tax=Longimycelium tulufanense TaxID=907463 RepID=A0A8J3FYH2_9PSEU|nr:hypothetical protein GCM10012275_60830 [Longimycelium tulufanense]
MLCRDAAGRRREARVTITDHQRVAVIVPAGEAMVLDPLAVGRMRAALRDAVIAAAARNA